MVNKLVHKAKLCRKQLIWLRQLGSLWRGKKCWNTTTWHPPLCMSGYCWMQILLHVITACIRPESPCSQFSSLNFCWGCAEKEKEALYGWGFGKKWWNTCRQESTNQRRRWRCKMLLTRHGQRQGSKALGLMTKTIWIKIERGFWLLDSGLPFSPYLFFSFVNEMSSVS